MSHKGNSCPFKLDLLLDLELLLCLLPIINFLLQNGIFQFNCLQLLIIYFILGNFIFILFTFLLCNLVLMIKRHHIFRTHSLVLFNLHFQIINLFLQHFVLVRVCFKFVRYEIKLVL